jgi:CRP-like cAMP-binding protein
MQIHTEPGLQLFLERLTRRSVLSDHERQAILRLPAEPWVVSTNNDFVRLDERSDHTSLIVSGLVGRYELTSEGRRQITNLYIGGDMPDLHSVVQPSSGSALHAMSGASILRIPHSALRGLANKYPGIAEALWRDCVVDLMIQAQWVVNVGRRDAKARIAHLLCEMACRYRAPVHGGKVLFHLPLTQSQLGDATALTPVHVNRSLKALQKVGLSFRGKTVRIEDWEAITAFAGFERGYLQEAHEAPQQLIAAAHG